MSSSAVATFNFTNLKGALPPADTDVGIFSVLKKRVGDTTLSFAFSDASLKDPRAGQGIILGAEATLKGKLYIDHGSLYSKHVELQFQSQNRYSRLFHFFIISPPLLSLFLKLQMA